MKPIRKYNLVINMKRNPEAKNVWKPIGEIAVWQNDDGTERLQTQLYMFHNLDIATFLQQPREQDPQYPQNNTTTPPQNIQDNSTTPPSHTEAIERPDVSASLPSGLAPEQAPPPEPQGEEVDIMDIPF